MNYLTRLGVLVMGCFVLAGCDTKPKPVAPPPVSPNKDHADHEDADGHKHPDTYAEAMHEITELQTAIKDALAKGDNDKADGPAHEIFHVLEDLPGLAAKASLSKAEQDEVKKASEQLLDSFGKIDEKIHSGEPATYDDVATEIEEAMATLQRVAKSIVVP